MKRIECLSNNTLKLIACVSMFLDHLGFLVFTNVEILRILGRLAFPIFAYMLVEGCFYTHNKTKHFIIILIFGIICQLGLVLFGGYYRFNIFLVFSISIILIYLFDYILRAKKASNMVGFIDGVVVFVASCIGLCVIEANTLIFFDNYSLYGIFTPVVLYVLRVLLPSPKIPMLCALGVLSIIYSICVEGWVMYFLLAAIPLLAMYNGKRGKLNMKYFFYIFYPAHFVLLECLALIL